MFFVSWLFMACGPMTKALSLDEDESAESSNSSTGARAWCKPTYYYSSSNISGTEVMTELDYNWNGNTLSYSDETYQTTSIYNDMGYVLESDTNYDDGRWIDTRFEYDCE